MVDNSGEIERLTNELEAVTAEAARKDRISRIARQASLDLLTAESLVTLIERLLELRIVEHQLALSVVLADPSHEIRQLVAQRNGPEQPGVNVVASIITFAPPYATLRHLVAQPFDADEHRAFFPNLQDAAVVALLPLFRDQRLIGVINVAGADASEFADETTQDAMIHLATVASLCLENGLNHERLIRAGLTDTLTGLSNRRYLDHRMQEELYTAKRYERPLACLMIDIDHFKSINDQHGHLAGDLALRHVAERVRQVARGSDVVARFGGEEFCVLAPATGETSAATLAERIRSAIDGAPVVVEGGIEIDVTVSVGVATVMPTGGLDDIEMLGQRLVDDADKAMYAAKRSGRNCVRGAIEAGAVFS